MTTGEPDFVSIASAAARLGVTEPRLRRAVARTGTPTQTQTRRTRTGTRTGTVLPVAALDALAAFLSEKGTEREPLDTGVSPLRHISPRKSIDAEPKQERERNPTQADAEAFAGRELAAEIRARLADRESEIAFLRGALNQSQATANALTTELSEARKQSAVLIAATAGAFNTAQIVAHAPENDAEPTGNEQEPTPRPWWRLWR